ncbi:MAG: hypothetical protein ACOZIN_11405 [Myxococcota bacterium]
MTAALLLAVLGSTPQPAVVPNHPAEEDEAPPWAVLRATSQTPARRLLANEVWAGLSMLGTGYTYTGGRWGDLFLEPSVEGRLVLSGFTADAALAFAGVTGSEGAGGGLTVGARAGWTGERFSVVGGAYFLRTEHALPESQLLPSVRASFAFSSWGLSTGVFDYRGLVPFHLTAELGDVGLGYVAPLGALLTARVRLRSQLGLRLTAFAFRVGNSETALLTVAAAFGPEAGRSKERR